MAYVSLLCLGFAAGAQVVSFGVVKDINPDNTIGTASGFNNMAVIIGAAIFQPLVGHMLEWHWSGVMYHGAPVYTAAAYHRAMWLIPLIYVLGFIISLFFIKETYCEPSFKKQHYHMK